MRVFPYIDKNIEEYIFSFLTPLDLALSKVVCKRWRDWIKSKKELNIRPSFKQDILEVLPIYDRDEYVHAIERYTCYEKITITPSYRRIENMKSLMDVGSIHSLLFCFRTFKFDGSKSGFIWATCVEKPELWNSILLPRLSKRRKKTIPYFWDSIRTNNTGVLKWMIERNLVAFPSTYMFKDEWIGPYHLEKIRVSLEFLRDNPRVPREFISDYIGKVWFEISPGPLDSFIFMVELFGFVSLQVCANASHEDHDLFRHVCQCSLDGSSFNEPDFKHQKIKTN